MVEDVTPNYRLAQVNLEKAGFDVERASDLEKVEELCADPEFVGRLSLVVVDLILRGVESGFDICRYLRSSPPTKHIPIFVLTSRQDIEARIEACEIGVNAYATKPYYPRDLVAVAKKLTYRAEEDQPRG